MNVQREPFLNPRDPDTRRQRNLYYDPDALDSPGSSLEIVDESITDLMAMSERGQSYWHDGDDIVHTFETELVEKFDEFGVSSLRTSVAVTKVQHGRKSPLREEVHTSITHEVGIDATPVVERYDLWKFAGGVASMDIDSTMDGVTFSLLMEGDRYMGHHAPRPATEYDATALFDEMQRLQQIQATQRYSDFSSPSG